MKNRYLFFATALVAAMSMNAQETYENAKITGQDLNGTARYVGMGGAMEALGADISTISSNPAGIGLFRSSNASVSGGLIMQGNGKDFANGKKTNASFDQIGGVYSTRTGYNSFLNFGFNYHKSKNFNYILNASNTLNGSSLNRQSYNKGEVGDEKFGGYFIDKGKDGNLHGYSSENSSNAALNFDNLDYLNWNTVLVDKRDGKYYSQDGQSYDFNRAQSGYISNYDFNISGNIKDRVYLGVTFGVKDVNYKGYSEYTENFGNNTSAAYYDSRNITGTGFDVTAGIIVRPMADSPFRIGAYVKSPTWYNLRTTNYTEVKTNLGTAINNTGNVSNSYDYKILTPWKFGVSLGHTVGNYLALGATYEYEGYNNISTRVIDGGYYDWYYDQYYDSSSADQAMNAHTKASLKGVSTLKLGLEYKPTSDLSVRLGYNYVTPAYKTDAYKDPTISSYGTAYTSASDYTNWKATNRITLGLGYQVKKFNIDLAYQYSTQQGDFYSFGKLPAYEVTNQQGQKELRDANFSTGTKVENNRSQLLLTLGYKF